MTSHSHSVNPPRVLCAVVTYNEVFDQTAVARSLANLPERWRRRIEICCAENEGPRRCDQPRSAVRSRHELEGMPVLKIETGCNGGLALGYNLAVPELLRSACEYILFLNSDAVVTEQLLDGFDEAATRSAAQPVAALAPMLTSAGRTVSPFRKAGFRHPFWIISFLFCHRSVFPADFRFPAEYWLDGIDFWLSHDLWSRSIAVTPIAQQIEHQLSVAQQFGSIPGWRYRNIIASELRFHRRHGNGARAATVVVLRAACRCLLGGRADLLPQIWRSIGEAK